MNHKSLNNNTKPFENRTKDTKNSKNSFKEKYSFQGKDLTVVEIILLPQLSKTSGSYTSLSQYFQMVLEQCKISGKSAEVCASFGHGMTCERNRYVKIPTYCRRTSFFHPLMNINLKQTCRQIIYRTFFSPPCSSVTEVHNEILLTHLRFSLLLFFLLFLSPLADSKEVRVSALSQWRRHKSFTQRLIQSIALRHQSAQLWI